MNASARHSNQEIVLSRWALNLASVHTGLTESARNACAKEMSRGNGARVFTQENTQGSMELFGSFTFCVCHGVLMLDICIDFVEWLHLVKLGLSEQSRVTHIITSKMTLDATIIDSRL